MKTLTLIMLIALPLTSMADYPYLRCFEIASQRHEVPLELLIGVARVESNFDADARSSAGAHGIMQVRWPVTARHLGVKRVAELYNPCVNIDIGASYLRELLDRFDDTELAIAAYNYGPTRLRSRADIPVSVQRYVNKVLASQPASAKTNQRVRYVLNSFNRYSRADAYANSIKRISPTLQPQLVQKGNNFVVLLDQDLSDFDRIRLSRMIDLREMH